MSFVFDSTTKALGINWISQKEKVFDKVNISTTSKSVTYWTILSQVA